jgi:hypothetical protein
MMNRRSVWPTIAGFVIIIVLLLAFTTVADARDDDPDDTLPTCSNPAIMRIVAIFTDENGAELVTCQDILDEMANDYGLGEIVKAIYLFQNAPGFADSWQQLLEDKQQEGFGWGQYKMAWRLSNGELPPETLFGWKQSGLGWGQIKQAMAIASVTGDKSVEDIIKMMQSGMDWEQIRAEVGYPPGPPPWAKGANKDEDGNVPPGWVKQAEKEKDKTKDKQPGPPAWANNKNKGK